MITHDFSGKVAFITGGTSGIGLAAARAFARAGARVVVASRSEEGGRKAVALLGGEGGAAHYVQCDVCEELSVVRAVGQTSERFGRLDVAFNCAGTGGDLAPARTDRPGRLGPRDGHERPRRPGWPCGIELPAIVASGGGSVVNMSSIYGAAGKAAHHAYVASKHAVLGMTRSVALEYASRGVRVNAVCAGMTATPGMRQAEQFVPHVVAALVREHPMGRMATEEEVASAVLWLSSDAAGFVTGAPFAVDGGFLAA